MAGRVRRRGPRRGDSDTMSAAPGGSSLTAHWSEDIRQGPAEPPPLEVSEKTSIAQLEAEGLLLDRTSRPIQPGKPGTKSRPVRIEQKRVRVIGMRLAIQHHWTGCTSPKRQGAKPVSQRLPVK